MLGADRGGDPVEGELARRSVHQCGAEEQYSRAEAADDQVLEPCLERAFELAVDRAEDVERDREPLEPQEERHQVVGGDEEAHAGAGRRQEGVVLGDVLVAHPLGVGDADREQARARDDHLRERAEPISPDRVGDHAVHVGGVNVDHDRVDECAGKAQRRCERAEIAAVLPRQQDGADQREAHGPEQHQLRCEREPVDVRTRDHFAASNCVFTSVRAWSCAKDRSVIATAPTTEYPQPRVNTPARISNSPANADEPGTANPMIPVVIRTVARIGRPRANPPRRANSPVAARRSIPPASRKSEAVISPWLIICSTAPLSPRSLTENTPNVISPSWARDEYAITPRTSGARNASSEP